MMPWHVNDTNHELRRELRNLATSPKHFDEMMARQDAYHKRRREMLRNAPAFCIDGAAANKAAPAEPVKPVALLPAVCQSTLDRARERFDMALLADIGHTLPGMAVIELPPRISMWRRLLPAGPDAAEKPEPKEADNLVPFVLPQDLQTPELVIEQVAASMSLDEAIRWSLGRKRDTARLLEEKAQARSAVRQVDVDDLHEAIEYALSHPDNELAQRLPKPYRLAHDGKEVYLCHPALLGKAGRLLVGVSINGDRPRPVVRREQVREYMLEAWKATGAVKEVAAA